MINNLLDWFKFNVGDGAIYALFGLLVVFAGIVILILLFTALGKIMKEANKPRAPRKRKKKENEEKPAEEIPAVTEEGISPELVAVISAAIAAYYEGENVKCDFVVKRIKRV